MEKSILIERAKMYLDLLSNGVHPVTGVPIPNDSAFMDEKVKRCFEFIMQVLDEYAELSEKVEKLKVEKEKTTIIVPKKQVFAVTQEQCENIRLSQNPISVLSFMKNINAVIDADTMEKLSSTRVNKWLSDRGLITTEKVATVVNRTVYKPSAVAGKIGITEEEVVDKKSGEVKTQIRLSKSAQLFIIENIEEIISTT